MLTLDNAELAFLAIIGRPKLTQKALKLYAEGTVLFNAFTYPHLECMLRAYMNDLKQSRQVSIAFSKDQIAADLSEAVRAEPAVTAELMDKSDALLQRYVTDQLPSEKEGLAQITRLVRKDATRKLGGMITDNADFAQLQQTLNRSKQLVEDISETDPDEHKRKFIFSPFKDIRELTRFMPRLPTGINWMDQVSHGGAREGECWLYLGPSGGGKSALAVQLACAQALMGNDTVWVTYEQTLYGDLSERMIANVTDTSLDDIRDKGYDNLPDIVRDRFESAVSSVQDKLTCLDMAQFEPDPTDPKDIGGVYSICRQVKDLKDSGKRIKFIIVDWIGAMASRVFARTGGNMKNDFQSFAQSSIIEAHDFGEANGVFFLFFHQTDTEAQHAKPTFCPNMTNARDDHGLCFYFDAVFAQGKRDVHNVCWLNPDKTRKAHTQPITLKLIGDRSRFDLVTGWVPNRDGKFYNPAEPDLMDAQEGEETTPASKSYRREVE